MTRAAFAMAIRADKAWISNASRILGRRILLTEESARRYALIRMLQQEFGFSLEDSAEAARSALNGPPDAVIVVRESVDGSSTLAVDMKRFSEAFLVTLAAAQHYAQPRRRGRPWGLVKDKIEACIQYGDDVSLIERNLDRSSAELLADLDEAEAFFKEIRFVR